MAFLIICLAVAFLIQLMVLGHTEKRLWRFCAPCAMCLPFLCGMVWYAVTRTSNYVFSWTDSIMFLLCCVMAVLIGCILAWVVYRWSMKKEK